MNIMLIPRIVSPLSIAFSLMATLDLLREVKIPDEYKQGGFAIGCQAYPFKEYSVFEEIEKTAETGGRVIEFFPGQSLSKEEPTVKWDHNATDDTIEKMV